MSIPSLAFNNPKFRRSLESEKSVGFDTESGIGWPGNADDPVGRPHTPVPRDHPSHRLSTRFPVSLALSNNRVVTQSTNRFIVWAGIFPLGGKPGDSNPAGSNPPKRRSVRRSMRRSFRTRVSSSGSIPRVCTLGWYAIPLQGIRFETR